MVFFAIAATLRTDKVTDLSYGLTFILVSWTGLVLSKNLNLVTGLLIIAVTIWGLRLGIYLFIRILKIQKDSRFDEIRGQFLSFLKFWLLQALTVWLVLLPVNIGLRRASGEVRLPIILGLIIWFGGLLIETIADWQKYTFKNDPENKGQWIEQGLWSWSRHPNYFGEMLCWWGLFIVVVPYLDGWGWLSISGPLFITFLLLFVTGIPPLEKRYDEKYGQDPRYLHYKETTSILIPLPPSGTK